MIWPLYSKFMIGVNKFSYDKVNYSIAVINVAIKPPKAFKGDEKNRSKLEGRLPARF